MYEADPKRIDCIVLDLDMPRLNGEQVHAQLREKYPHVRVLISSGYLDHEREASLRKAGVDGILYKPYDSSALLSAVKDLLKPAASNANPT
jgi:DNA-binding NarL/FixJ family response regulator